MSEFQAMLSKVNNAADECAAILMRELAEEDFDPAAVELGITLSQNTLSDMINQQAAGKSVRPALVRTLVSQAQKRFDKTFAAMMAERAGEEA